MEERQEKEGEMKEEGTERNEKEKVREEGRIEERERERGKEGALGREGSWAPTDRQQKLHMLLLRGRLLARFHAFLSPPSPAVEAAWRTHHFNIAVC